MGHETICNLDNIKTYSFSRLNSFYQCKKAWFLNYVQNKQGRQNSFALFGTIVHDIMERYLNGEIEQEDLCYNLEADVEEKLPYGIVLKGDGWGKKLTDSYISKTINFFDNFDNFEGYEVVDTEKHFALLTKIDDDLVILNGYIDVVLKDSNDDIIIVDWKSKSKFKSKKELSEYARQLYMYSIYIKETYGKFPKELWFEQFKENHREKIIFNNEDFEETLLWIRNTIININKETLFEESIDNFFCRNLCGYGHNEELCDWKEKNKYDGW